MHSYNPASSGRKYGISRTPLELLILILPGKGFPSALLHVMTGTGLDQVKQKCHISHMLCISARGHNASLSQMNYH